MNLNEIYQELLSIEEGLDCGTIEFTCDNLTSAMKCGHPADIFDGIIAEVYWDTQAGLQPEEAKLENLLNGLKRFKRSFKVKELGKPIKDLTSYLSALDVRQTK